MQPGIRDIFSPDEVRELTAKSNVQGAWALIRTWGIVAGSFAVLAQWPHPLMWLLVIAVLGGQQLGFAIITHEAAHRTLFRQRWLNSGLADWLCARIMWLDVERYRTHHIKHHAHTGSSQDPDMSLVTPYPCSRSSLRRKIVRDLVGISGLRRMLGLLLMDIGVLNYSVSSEVTWVPKQQRTFLSCAKQGIVNLLPVVAANALLFGALAACGIAWVYWAWVLAYLGTFSLFIRIRSIAEHACLPGGENMFENTRTTRAGWLARLSVAPLHVNFHQEHHLMASVPFYRLPRMHQMLRERMNAEAAPGYLDVLRAAISPNPAPVGQ
ncbi:MAG: fatty acid desaturase family protein [Oceanococcus sp.]